ncbi:hypothetical protein [Microcystis phage Mel-JY01]
MNKVNPNTIHVIKSPPACGLIVKSKDGYVLLMQRNYALPDPFKSPNTLPGTWSVPSGGVKVNRIESLDACAIRVFTEKTDVQLPPGQKLLLLERYVCYGKVYYLFVTQVDRRFRVQLDRNHAEYNWFKLDELPSPITDELLNALSKLK